MSARHEPPPRQRKGPTRRHAPGPVNSESVVDVGFTPEPTLLAMASRLVDDGIAWTPVRAKKTAFHVADRLRRQLPVSPEEASVVRQLFRQRRDELLAAARLFSGFAGCT